MQASLVRLALCSFLLLLCPMASSVHIMPLHGLPEIAQGDDLAAHISRAARSQDLAALAGDIFVVAQKIVSKAEGRVVPLDGIVPSERARRFADEHGKDARLIELVLRE